MLHTLSQTPSVVSIETILHYLLAGDAILLLQNGVIAGLSGTHAAKQLLAADVTIYALLPDLLARGLLSYLAKGIIPISYTDFVALTVQHKQQLAW